MTGRQAAGHTQTSGLTPLAIRLLQTPRVKAWICMFDTFLTSCNTLVAWPAVSVMCPCLCCRCTKQAAPVLSAHLSCIYLRAGGAPALMDITNVKHPRSLHPAVSTKYGLQAQTSGTVQVSYCSNYQPHHPPHLRTVYSSGSVLLRVHLSCSCFLQQSSQQSRLDARPRL